MATMGDGRPPPEDSAVYADSVFERILEAYRRHFDISLDYTLMGTTIPALAHFYSRGEKYVLTKKAKLWGVECNEYALFFNKNSLRADNFHLLTDFVEAAEAELVKPHSEHMYTYLSAVVLTDGLTEETASLIRRYKWRKSYKLSLHGWCNIRLAVLDLSKKVVLTNRDGKEMRKALEQALALS